MSEPGAGREAGSPEPMPRPPWVRPAKIVAGLLLLPLGVVGLFLPFLQGVVFLLAALALLSSELPFVRRWKEQLRKRYPKLFLYPDEARIALRRWKRRLRDRRRGKEGESDDRS